MPSLKKDSVVSILSIQSDKNMGVIVQDMKDMWPEGSDENVIIFLVLPERHMFSEFWNVSA